MRRTFFGVAALSLALLTAPAGAQTPGPQYMDSEPGRGATVHKAPSGVTIRFDTPLDSSSEIAVVDGCGDGVSGATSVSGFEMSAPVSGDRAGNWTVRYTAESVGGAGSTTGSYSFFVHAGPSCGGSSPGSTHHHGSGDGGREKGGQHRAHSEDHFGKHAPAGGHSDGHASGDMTSAGGHTSHSSGGSHDSGFGHSHDESKKHGDHEAPGGKSHGKDHGKKSKGSAPESVDDSPSSGRISPQMSLALALLIPALAGITGGFVLRRRFAQA